MDGNTGTECRTDSCPTGQTERGRAAATGGKGECRVGGIQRVHLHFMKPPAQLKQPQQMFLKTVLLTLQKC